MTNKKKLITKEIIIGEMIKLYPETADIMLSWGLACVGCSINQYETLEEGVKAHGGMNDSEISKLVTKLNKVAKPVHFLKVLNFEISERALEKIQTSTKEDKKENHYLRITANIDEDGDENFGMKLEKKVRKGDTSEEVQNVKFTVDSKSLTNLEDYQIDYIDTALESGFKFDKK